MVKKLLFLAAATVILAGCPGKNNNSQPVAPVGYGPGAFNGGCASCAQLRTPFAALTGVRSSDTGQRILFALDLFIDGGIPGFNYSDPKAFLYYSGPVVVQGIVRILDANDPLVCNIAPGDYQFVATSVSVANYGVVRGGTFEATGPGGKMLIRMGDSQVNNMTDQAGVVNGSPNNRIGLNLNIDSVSNYPYPCGPLSTF